jgi:hypothetical protein
MTKVRGVTGGGISGNKVSSVYSPKTEPKPHAVSVGAVSRLGGLVGEGAKFKAFYNQQGYTNPIGPTPSVAGVAGGRIVLPCGSQSSVKAPTPRTKGRPF